MRGLLFAAGALLLASAAQGQSYPLWQSSPGSLGVPASATALSSSTVYVTEFALTDPTGAAVTVTVSDSSGIIWTIPMGGTNPTILSWEFFGWPFAGNMTWQASVANTVKGHVWGHY